MSRLEEVWVHSLDSATWRRWVRLGPINRLYHSGPFRSADLARRYALSLIHARRSGNRYTSVRSLCLMIGHMKSGGSLLGAMLDAHPEVAFADDADALGYVASGFRPKQVFYLLEKSSRREAIKGRVTGRRLEPYSLRVPGQAPGETTILRVIGDAKAGITTQRLGGDPSLLSRLQDGLGDVDLRFIHVIRNPFDPISVMMLRGQRTLQEAVARYFANCAIISDLRTRLPSETIHVVRYENLVDEPARHLAEVCRFLGLGAGGSYVDACAVFVQHLPPERTKVPWTNEGIDTVEAEIARFPFLAGYRFEQHGSTT